LQCGGSEKFVSLLCDHIDTEKFSVCLVVLNNASQFYRINKSDVEVVNLKEKRVRYALFKIRSIIKKQQPDIVFTTANHQNLYFAIFRHWFPKNIKFVARESSIVSINSQRATMPSVYNRLIKKYYNRFDLIICQSAYMQQDLIRNYNIPENKTTVIHNAVEISQGAAPAVLADKPAGRVYKFITVGRLSEEKGVERLIHAVGLLSISFRFYIIGEGSKRKDLQNLVHELQLGEQIFFEGEKKEPFSGMEDADFFLMGSYYEGFPNVLIEAGALGIPVIAFNVPGGIPEIISEENGLLVNDNDILGFATEIRNGLSLNFNRSKIIENTKKRFSADIIPAQVENVLTQL
jgi:glycosyltransferase involved in cell wall biosynthesis